MDETITKPASPPCQPMLPRPTLIRAPPSALETGHEYAARLERYAADEDFKRAAEMAYKASDCYKKAADSVSDNSIKSTMLKLYEEYERKGKEYLRRQERAERHPPPPVASTSRSPPNHITPQVNGDARSKAQANGIQRLESAISGSIGDSAQSMNGASTPRQLSRLSTATSEASTMPPGESFMLLADRDPADPFNQFWGIMQGIMNTMTPTPLAFAAALNGEYFPPPEAKDGEGEEGVDKEHREDGSDEEDPDSDFGADSFYVIPRDQQGKGDKLPHSYPPRRPKTQEELYHENMSLKMSLDATTRRLEACQLALRQKELAERMNVRRLQSSMLDVRVRMQGPPSSPEKEKRPSEEGTPTQRLPDFNPKLFVPAPGPGVVVPEPPKDAGLEAEVARLQKRVKEVEEENGKLKLENEKNRQSIARYRERWEKLKDSAKKKREAKTAAGGSNGVPSIAEDAEGEAAGEA